MKPKIIGLALLGMAASAALGQPIGVTVNGERVNFAGAGPQSVQGRVLVPLRGVLERLGAYVEWVPSTRTVVAQRGDIDIQLRVGSNYARVNGRDVNLDVPAQVYLGTTLVPLRFMGEALGADVRWDNAQRVVRISTDGSLTGGNAQQPGGSTTQPNNPNTGNNTNTGTGAPVITSFRHDGDQWIGPSERVEIIMEGTPGGTATFQIPGLVNSGRMVEVSPGRYQGSWAGPRANNATALSGATVIGRLVVNGREQLIQAGETLSVDTAAPRVTTANPEEGSTVPNDRPSIYVVFDDAGGSGIDTESVRLLVNRADVTNNATVSGAFVNYRPDQPLPGGATSVSVVGRDRAGNQVMKSWTFNVTTASTVIRNVSFDNSAGMSPGDVITVRAEAQPGGRAVFSIGERRNLPMREESRGVYVGEYTIRRGESLTNVPVIVTYTTPNGQTFTSEANSGISLNTGQLEAPTITSPATRTGVRSPLVVEGRATPGTRVNVRVSYQTVVLGGLGVNGTLGEQTVTVGNDGRFRTEAFNLDTLVSGRDTEYTITATTMNTEGRRSEPITLNFTR